MDWIEIIKKAIFFIESEIGNSELSSENIAKHVHLCETHFSRAFNIITGYTLSKYIRNRRLSIAGQQLNEENISVLDAAINVGYDSPEAFSKAFKRFHGVNPSECTGAELKEFHPLNIKLELTHEPPLIFNIESKNEIFLCGETIIVEDNDDKETYDLWIKSEDNGYLDSCYSFNGFETLVGVTIGGGYTIKAKCENKSTDTSIVIPPHKWAIFKCDGDMSKSIVETWSKIYTIWMKNYQINIAELPMLEVYFEDDNCYSCEIWIPIK